MINSRDIPWLMVVTLCAAVGLYAGFYGLSAGVMTSKLMAVALIAVSIGLVVLFVASAHRQADVTRDLRRMAEHTTQVIRETRDERMVAADFAAQVSVMRSEAHNHANAMSSAFHDLREHQLALAGEMRKLAEWQRHLAVVPAAAVPEPAAVVESREAAPQQDAEQPEAAAPVSAPVQPGIAISLEPIVDMFSGKTAHYRLHFVLTVEGEADIPQDRISHFADEGSLRPGLDVHLVREALAMLKILRARDARLSILVPIGAHTLSSPEALSQLVALHLAERSVSDGLVLDLSHAVLASLPTAAFEGLAHLARNGIVLGLSNAAVQGVDLHALQQLNVRYVGIAAGSIGEDAKLATAVAQFVQIARGLGLTVMVTGVGTMAQAQSLMRIARFASGAAFALPRRVRRDHTTFSTEGLVAAAE
jgi:EAL domain-containing protein (putative c-di-GMP-specific phosphodiesterase class I)